MRVVRKTRLRGLDIRSMTSTVHCFSNVRVGSFKNVNKLGAIGVHDVKAGRIKMFCSNVRLNGTRGKRISLKQFSLSGVRTISVCGKRHDTVFRSTGSFNSSNSVCLRDHAPGFRSSGHCGMQNDFGAKSFNIIGPSVL